MSAREPSKETVKIDQSGKIEDTARPTVLAFCNKQNFTIKIEARVKRQLQEIFRREGKTKLFIYRTFSALVFLLLRKHLDKINQVIIDTEYPGHEKLVKEIILDLIRKFKLKEPEIRFQRIGNQPKVHYVAYNVFAKKKIADRKISLREVLSLAIKNDRGLKD